MAGIIVTAAADEQVLSDPAATTATAWMILGGPALFLAGHAAFKLVVWRFVSWPRVAGIVVLALLALAARAIPALALAACTAVWSPPSPPATACPGCPARPGHPCHDRVNPAQVRGHYLAAS